MYYVWGAQVLATAGHVALYDFDKSKKAWVRLVLCLSAVALYTAPFTTMHGIPPYADAKGRRGIFVSIETPNTTPFQNHHFEQEKPRQAQLRSCCMLT